MAAELSPDPSWQGGDSYANPNLSHALAPLQWLLQGQHSQCVGHWESPQPGRQKDAATSTGTQGMLMAGRSHPTPPAIPLGLGSHRLPRAAVKPVGCGPAYSHSLQTRK